MIAEMHGKGIPVELIVSTVARFEEAMAARAVSTGQTVDTSTIDKRRAWDRERKRRQRVSAESTGIPPDFHRNPPDGGSILTSLSISPKGVKEKKESKKDARGTRIPPDFSISDDDRKFAASLGIPPDAVEAETPQFIDYWSSVSGRHGVKVNWKATWRNRMRDLAKYRGRGNFNGTSQAKSGSSLIAALDRKLAALEAEDGADLALPESPLLRISG
jgi:hypothetical protein